MSPRKSRRDVPSISLLLIFLLLHGMKTLQGEAEVQLQTMTSPQSSLPLEVHFCARQVLIQPQMDLKVKANSRDRIGNPGSAYLCISSSANSCLLLLPTDHFQLNSTKIPRTYFLFPSSRLLGQGIYKVVCHE